VDAAAPRARRRVGDASAGAVLVRLIIAALVAAGVARLLFCAAAGPAAADRAVVPRWPRSARSISPWRTLLGVEEVSTAVRRIGRRFGSGPRAALSAAAARCARVGHAARA
jgi:hypothetical protein